jgi:hypothetical protein
MRDHDAGADVLQRHVDRAGQARRIGRLHGLVVVGPQRQPGRPVLRGRLLQLGEQGAAGRELLARDRALPRVIRRAEGGDPGAVQRRAEGDDHARAPVAAVVHVPEPGDDPARRVSDHRHRARPGGEGLVDISLEDARLHVQVPLAVTFQLHDDGAPPGFPDPARQDVE